MKRRRTYEELEREIKSLRFRLEEAEQALGAIRSGDIDTLVVTGKGGEQVYTLRGADHSYRVLLEGLNEAALTLTPDGTILYCNDRFSEMSKTSPKKLLGLFVHNLIHPAERKVFKSALLEAAVSPIRREFRIRAADRSIVPALLSIKSLELGGLVVFCMVVTEISEQKRIEEALQKSEQHFRSLFLEGERMQGELRKLSREILRVQEEERIRISREIHDEIGQALTAISLHLKSWKANGRPSVRRNDIQSVQRIVEKAVDFIHDFSRQIHPSMLEDLGLYPALRSFVRDFQANTGMRVSMKLSGTAGKASMEQKATLYRIVQESLTNVLKHSGTRDASVIIRKHQHGISLQVADKGKGFETTNTSATGGKRQGMGLLGMRERVNALGGKLVVLSRPGHGTRVRVHLPLTRGGGGLEGAL